MLQPTAVCASWVHLYQGAMQQTLPSSAGHQGACQEFSIMMIHDDDDDEYEYEYECEYECECECEYEYEYAVSGQLATNVTV